MTTEVSAAERLLLRLGAVGVPYLFGNAGTDAAPLVEAYARAGNKQAILPRPVIATHENLAFTMAHGYSMVSGNLPCVFVHVSVGTANAACGVMNAARENVPVLLMAGRSPIYEDDTLGARDASIHWGQEMFDQASIVREFVKWDYELRGAAQVDTVVDRAATIATSEPKGPVYLTLPREVLAAPYEGKAEMPPVPVPTRAPRPNAEGLAEVARILAAAERPLIIAGNSGRDLAAFDALADFAARFEIPVVAGRSRYLPLPSDHPMHLGYEAEKRAGEADVIVVLEADVPWVPRLTKLQPGCKFIHVGFEPLHGHIPIRSFPADVALTCSSAAFLADLAPLMQGRANPARREWIAAERRSLSARRAATLEKAQAMSPLHPAWISHCIGKAKDEDSIVVNEYKLLPDYCPFTLPGTYFGSSSASGLGWGMGAALGAKLAEPDRLVFCVQGDGAYLFSNPVAAHYAASHYGLGVVFVVVNNSMWNAVRVATMAVYPDGAAAKAPAHELTMLGGLPAFEEVCAAAGGHGERVTDPADLPAALERAVAAARKGQQALLNIIIQPNM